LAERFTRRLRPNLRLLLYLLLALALRLLLFRHFPALLTNDSPDYIKAAYAIYSRLDFANEWLGDVRMPGYPLFLAALYPVTGTRSDLLVLAQSLLGLLCVPLGWQIGRLLRTPRIADGLALFFAFNPAYLLLEHALMTEALALFLMLAFTTVALIGLQRAPAAWLGLLAAALLGLSGLVRVNLLPYGCVLLSLLTARWLALCWRDRQQTRRMARAGVLLAVLLPPLLGLAVTLGPWLGRNYALYGTVSLSAHSDRSLLMWKTMSATMDANLPLFQRYAGGRTVLDFDWLNEFSARHATVEAETIAAAIVAEQAQAYPGRHLRAMLRSGLNHIGVYSEGYVPRDDRAMIAYWFYALVNDPASVATSVPDVLDWLAYTPVDQPSIWTAIWRLAGTIYLQVMRPLLFIALAAATARLTLAVWRRQLSPAAYPVYAVAGLIAAYAATLTFHAVTLTGSDRFGTLSDWVALAVTLYVFPRVIQNTRPT
jgi:hypothetical protein